MDIYSIGLKVDSRQVKQAQGDLGRFGQQSKKTGDSVKKFGRQVDRSAGSVKKMSAGADIAKRAIGGLIAALSVRQLQQFAMSTIAAADAIDNAARTAGIGAERLQELRFAFGQLVGTTEGDVDAALRRFNRRLGLAAGGTGAAKDSFKELDIAIQDAGGSMRDTDVVLEESLRKLSAIESDSERAAQASQMFGEDAGPRLAAALGEGIDAMDDAASQAVTMSNEIAAQGSQIQDDIDAMTTNIRVGLQNAFLGAVVRNEEQIRSLVATTLRGIGTIVQYGDELAGPVGAGILGRVLVGKKTGAVLAAVTGTVQIVNTIIDRLNQTVGHELARVEEQIDDLVSKYEERGMEIPVGAQQHLDDLRERQEELNNQVVDSIDLQKDYNEQLENNKDVGEEAAKAIFGAADAFEQMPSGTSQDPIDVGTVTGGSGSGKTEKELKSIDSNLSSILGKIDPIAAAGQSFASDMRVVQEALDAGRLSTSKAQEITEQLEEDYNKATRSARGLEGALEDIAENMTEDVSNGLTDIIMQAKSAEEVFASLARQIAKTIIQQQIANPIAEGITGFATSAIGSAFGGGSAGFQGVGNATPRQFANGGNVFGDTPAIVGERGPELFVPRQDGQIVPNHQMGGGGDVTVNVINQGGEQLEAEQQQTRRGPNGEMTVDVMVKKSMERLDSQGQLDGIFRRHGARRQGQF